MNFAAIADHYYLIERENEELKASKQRLMTALAGATTTVLQMEREYDALKAVETAARRLKAERDTDAATGANDDALETADAELDEALAALDAIRAQEAVR